MPEVKIIIIQKVLKTSFYYKRNLPGFFLTAYLSGCDALIHTCTKSRNGKIVWSLNDKWSISSHRVINSWTTNFGRPSSNPF